MTRSLRTVDDAGGSESGSLAEMVAETVERRFIESFPPATLAKIAVLAVLFALFNYWQFPRLVNNWRHDANWTHGFVIPLFSIYLLYSRRDELMSAKRRISILGLPVTVLAILWIIWAKAGVRNDWLSQLGMSGLLFGLVLYLGGAKIIRITWLPIFYLVFAMPIPDRLYHAIALPLQNFAAKGAAFLLHLFGTQIRVAASSLTVLSRGGVWHTLQVAEVCSGIRSMMAYLALGVAMAYIEDRPLWQRVVLVASAVPIAVLCNIIRVGGTCAMYVIDRPQLGQKFMHNFMGILMLIPALLMLLLVSWLLHRLYIEVDDEAEAPHRAPATGGKKA